MEPPFTAYKGNEPYVFVSYAHQDRGEVYPEILSLHQQGINIWYDEGIEPGSSWSDELAEAIDEAHVVLFLGTPNAAGSKHCVGEISYALDNDIPLLVAYLEPTDMPKGMQLRLNTHQAIFRQGVNDLRFRRSMFDALSKHVGSLRLASPHPETARLSPNEPRRRWDVWVLTILGVALVLSLILLGLWLRPPEADRSIVILPFESLSEDPSNVFFAAGMHEEILSVLSRWPELRVISRTTAKQYAGTNKSVAQIASELGVAHVLEGSVRRANDRIRITVKLIEAASNKNVWSQNYERPLTDIFAIQQDVSRQITSAMKAPLGRESAEQTAISTTNVAAYESYLRARTLLETKVADNIKAAVGLLEQATELDPEFAEAWASLMEAYHRLNWQGQRWREVADVAMTAGRKALALNPDSSIVHLAWARLYLGIMYDRELAAKHFRNAIEADPNNSYVMRHYGRFLDNTEGLELLQRSVALDPLSGEGHIFLAAALNKSGSSDEALKHIERGLEVEPGNVEGMQAAVYLHDVRGEYRAAWRVIDRMLSLNPDDISIYKLIHDRLLWLGDHAAARRWIERMQGIVPRHWIIGLAHSDALIAAQEYEALTEFLEAGFGKTRPLLTTQNSIGIFKLTVSHEGIAAARKTGELALSQIRMLLGGSTSDLSQINDSNARHYLQYALIATALGEESSAIFRAISALPATGLHSSATVAVNRGLALAALGELEGAVNQFEAVSNRGLYSLAELRLSCRVTIAAPLTKCPTGERIEDRDTGWGGTFDKLAAYPRFKQFMAKDRQRGADLLAWLHAELPAVLALQD